MRHFAGHFVHLITSVSSHESAEAPLLLSSNSRTIQGQNYLQQALRSLSFKHFFTQQVRQATSQVATLSKSSSSGIFETASSPRDNLPPVVAKRSLASSTGTNFGQEFHHCSPATHLGSGVAASVQGKEENRMSLSIGMTSNSQIHKFTLHIYTYVYIYMLDGPLGSIMHPTGSTRYMAPLDT